MKVLLVDDQARILKATKQLVNWEGLGVDEVFTALDAQEAKEIMRSQDIDILLADIEMPGENGIELQKWQAQEYPEVSCIFLTSHADFRYAQEAIRNGAFDYILQPASVSDIEETLSRCIAHRNEQRAILQKNEEYDERMPRIVESHVAALFYQKDQFRQMEEWRQDTHTPEEDWMYLPCLLHIWGRSALSCEAALQRALEAAGFSRNGFGYEESVLGEDEIGIVFYIRKDPPALPKMQERLQMLLDDLLDMGNIEINMYLGSYAKEDLPDEIGRVMEYASGRLLKHGRVYQVERSALSELPMPDGMQWGKWLVRRDLALVQNQITNLLHYAGEENRLTLDYMEHLIQAFLQALSIACYELKWDVRDLFDETFSRERLVNAGSSEKELQQCVAGCLHRYNELLVKRTGTDIPYSNKERILDIQRYIEENMERMISRKEAAKYVMLSEDYFTRIFKKETGMGYKEYVLTRKMDYAKELLENTDLPVALVASKAGYDNFTNFSQMFRKYTGMTPSAYRKEQGKW